MKSPYLKRITLSNNVHIEAYSTNISLWSGDSKHEVFIELKDINYFIQELKQLVVEVKCFEAKDKIIIPKGTKVLDWIWADYRKDVRAFLDSKKHMSLENEIMLDKLSEL